MKRIFALCRRASLLLIVAATIMVLARPVPTRVSATGSVADRVFGQGGNFTTNGTNQGGLGPGSLNSPRRIGVASTGELYVPDCSNNRVLEYDSPLTSQTANHVFGQPNFTSSSANNGGLTANSLNCPIGATVDAAGHLYIADWGNNRVLEYDNPLTSQTANRVFGQGGSFTTNACNTVTTVGWRAGPELQFVTMSCTTLARKIVLSFDDGGAFASGILDVLDRYGVKAIFFPIGT